MSHWCIHCGIVSTDGCERHGPHLCVGGHTMTINLNGSVTMSNIIDGHRVQRTYHGYSQEEAWELFSEEVSA